jgi:hypothetical protein
MRDPAPSLSLRAPLLVALALIVACAAPAGALAAGGETDSADDAIVVVSGPVEVAPGSAVEGVFVVHGDVKIAGTVRGDVVAIDGDVDVTGKVDGDVVTVAGKARVLDGASVSGELSYWDEEPEVSPGAEVGGKITKQGWDETAGTLAIVGAFALWLAVTVSMLVLGVILVLLLPRAADAVFAQARDNLAVSVAVGLAVLVALPVVALVAALTLLGLPLALLLGLALLPLAAIAYVAGAWALGRALIAPPRGRIASFLVGLAILRVAALVPVLGFIVWLAAVAVGLGVLAMAVGAAREAPGETQAASP